MITAPSLLLALSGLVPMHVAPPVVRVSADDTVINKSCIVEIAPGAVIRDVNNDGVIKITADNIVVEFRDGSVLRGAPAGTAGDELTGTGIRLDKHKGVTIRNAHVEGYKIGLHATGCDGFTLEKSEFNDNFRQRLRSTPAGEDGADWLSPHHNDKNEWVSRWGGAVYIRDASDVTVREVRVRNTQNGVLIHAVNDSRVYDNDCSFLSGWGLGMFRSSRNTITRNALDFCVRGHVEGVYNRGQDSAGILCFEQCSNNVFAENSATHGGDCFFAFAGLEALNGEGAPPGYDYTRKGCNDNLFIDNDFSYAPAHGLELTFSFGNKVFRNRFVENAICGIWGGYSQDFLVADNLFQGNGGMAYGLERGGVNIEHGAGNRIIANTFLNNRCGVHLWWDGHGDFESKTWGKANYKGVSNNVIAGNTFVVDANNPFSNLRETDKLIDLHLRDDSKPAGGKVLGTVFADNTVTHSIPQAVGIVATEGIKVSDASVDASFEIPKYEVLGSTTPVGARPQLRGRDKIIMTEWGPWDHESPLLRSRTRTGTEHVYEAFAAEVKLGEIDPAQGVKVTLGKDDKAGSTTISISAAPGVHAYRIPLTVGDDSRVLEGTIFSAEWAVTSFTWDKATDPRENLEGWRALAKSDKAVHAKVGAIKFNYGMGGPRDQPWGKTLGENTPANDRFGTIATTRLNLPKGTWKFRTLSDDGVRVTVNGKPIIENWTWHAPAPNDGVFTQEAAGEVSIVVEHFEIDGFSVLELDINPAQ